MAEKRYEADVVIVGGGIAGIAAALELLRSPRNLKVLLLDRDEPAHFGGLAKESFGGMFFVNTPHQRRLGIRDSPELALQDWLAFAEFEPDDVWPRRWAEQYVNRCTDDVFRWLGGFGVGFFPVVHWVERGMYTPGNSVPRFHMVWGTGHGLVTALLAGLKQHKNAANLRSLFRHNVTRIDTHAGQASGVSGIDEQDGAPFIVAASHVIIAAGGICGSIDLVKQYWYAPWGEPPETILNGSHPYADGQLLRAAAGVNAHITHLDKSWHYAAGVHHPHPKPNRPGHGLSLVPPKSALWVGYDGRRLGDVPLISGYDTRYLVEQVCRQPVKHSWQIMNWKIAKKELAISGAEFNDAIREKKLVAFLLDLLRGNEKLLQKMVDECPDFVVAHSLTELADKMNDLTDQPYVTAATLQETIAAYDAQIERGPKFHNDDQLRRLAHLRQYRGDRVRTCKFAKILDADAMPLVAIREFILSRKSLGGIQTDLHSRVLTPQQTPISNLYAIGEAAGFGGGGAHGLRALEGTFLGTCVLTGRLAAQHIME